MCKYCDKDSKNRRIFFDKDEREFYIRSYYWDDIKEDWTHDKLYLYEGFCPFCGENLIHYCGVINKTIAEILAQEWETWIKEKDSYGHHCITEEEIKIIEAFCDNTGIHGEELKEILLEGLLLKNKRIEKYE